MSDDARSRAGQFLLRKGHSMGQRIDAGKVQDYLEQYEAELTRLKAKMVELGEELERYRVAFREILILGNHVANALIGMGGLPNDYKTYTEALEARGQPYADFWCAWSAIMEARNTMEAKGGTQ